MTGKRITFPPTPVCKILFSSAGKVSAVPGWQEPLPRWAGTVPVPLPCPAVPSASCQHSHLWGHTEPSRETTWLKKKKFRKNLTSISAEIAPKHLTRDSTALLKQQNKNPSHEKTKQKKKNQNFYSLVSPGRKNCRYWAWLTLPWQLHVVSENCRSSPHTNGTTDLAVIIINQLKSEIWRSYSKNWLWNSAEQLRTALKMELMAYDLQLPEILPTPVVPLTGNTTQIRQTLINFSP